jgi:hypothetical protein
VVSTGPSRRRSASVPGERDGRTLRAKLRDYFLEEKAFIVFLTSTLTILTFAAAAVLGIAQGIKGGPLSGLVAALFTLLEGVACCLIALLGNGIISLLYDLIFGGLRLLRHWSVRGLLVGAGVAPWRYGAFLDAMTERLLLRRSGAGYVFTHALLRDYFADRASIDLHAKDTAVK